jgi:hypothetical protein
MVKKEDHTIELSIETIKEQYSTIKKKYNLPEFKELNEEFDIAKIDTNKEVFLRDIRKTMISKLSSILTFIELLLNPGNGPMFHLYLVKGITQREKDILNQLFDKLGKIEIESFELDIDYSEKKEAEFIIHTSKEWKIMKKDLLEIILILKKNWGNNSTKKEKSYFG